MPDELVISSIGQAEQLLLSFIDDPEFSPSESMKLGDWVRTHVYIPDEDIHSEISPPYMEAFLGVQKSIYLFAAYAKFGVANPRLLSDLDRHNFEIIVKVSGGSAEYVADLSKALGRCLKVLSGKMDGRQATLVILGLGLLFTTAWCFPSWIESQRAIKIDENHSKEHIEALRALTTVSHGKDELYKKLLELLDKQGHAGEIVIVAANTAYDALLKAASKTDMSIINGQALTSGDADLLRKTARKVSTKRYVIERVRVVDINTSDPKKNTMVLMNVDTNEQNRMALSHDLFVHDDRKKLIKSLDTLGELWAELAINEIDGEVKSVEFLRTVEDPEKSRG
ncbi:MAG TPA: hypothetical protein VIE65_11520, partial [Methylobacter sp.]